MHLVKVKDDCGFEYAGLFTDGDAAAIKTAVPNKTFPLSSDRRGVLSKDGTFVVTLDKGPMNVRHTALNYNDLCNALP